MITTFKNLRMPEALERIPTALTLRLEVAGREAIIHISRNAVQKLGSSGALHAELQRRVQTFYDNHVKETDYEEGFTGRTVERKALTHLVDNLDIDSFEEYKEWCQTQGMNPVEAEEFSEETNMGATQPRTKTSVEKRFNCIRRNGMSVGRSVRLRKRRQDKGTAIREFTPNAKIIIENRGDAQDPLNLVVVS